MWWNVQCSSGSDQIRVKHGFGRSVQMTSIMLTTNSTTNTNAIKLAEKERQWGQLRIPDPNYAIACWPVLGPRTPFSSTLNHFVKKCDPPFFWQWKCGKSNLPAPLSIMSVGTKTIKCYQLQLQRSPCLHPASLSTDTGAEFSQPRTIQFYNINPWIKINKSMLKL